MLVDTWMLVALSQIALVALIAAVFALFRSRRVASRNVLLEERCSSARKALEQARTLLEALPSMDTSEQPDWKTLLGERLAELDTPSSDEDPDSEDESAQGFAEGSTGGSEDQPGAASSPVGDGDVTDGAGSEDVAGIDGVEGIEGAAQPTPDLALALEKLLLQHIIDEDRTDLVAKVTQLLSPDSLPAPQQRLDTDQPEEAGQLPELEAENGRLKEKIQALEISHEALKSAKTVVSEESLPVKEEELKALVKQFTQDSRDMLSCIQNLEMENQELREKLDLSATSSAHDAPSATPSTSAPADDGDAEEHVA